MRIFIDHAGAWRVVPGPATARADTPVRLVQDDFDGVYDDRPVRAAAAA